MSILETAKTMLTDVASTGYNKAKEIRDTTKYTMDIRSVETTINQYYKEIGRAYYEKHKNDENFEFPQIAAIRNAFAERARLQGLKDQARGVAKCPRCGKTVGDMDRFCTNCGERLREVVEGEVVRDGSNVTMQPQDVVDRAAEKVKEFSERAASRTEELKEDMRETAQRVAENADDVIGDAREAADGLSRKMSRNAEQLKNDATDAAGFLARKIAKGAEKLKDAAEGFADKAAERTAAAEATAAGAAETVKESTAEATQATAAETAETVKERAEEAAQAAAAETAEAVHESVSEAAETTE